MAQNPYSIRGGEVGRNRLRLLADVMRGGTDPLLDRFCMPGMRCLDLGSGVATWRQRWLSALESAEAFSEWSWMPRKSRWHQPKRTP
ncbi:MAG: hypothetical protein H3C58_11940 [Fimbriimonadaceae bacterium]|nr:hypothetical protein [Fimbriimonadaceae bacterium]